MKRSWAADQEMLVQLQEICKEHSLRMFACYGTLLGTVREGGFIAWDDDIDVGFVGEDYVRFLDVLTNEYPNRFNVLNPYTRPWYKMNFSHITNSKSVTYARNHLEKWHGCPFMTGPDVYPYYYLPSDPAAEKYILGILGKIDELIMLNRQSVSLSIQMGDFDKGSRLNESIAIGLVELQHETGFVFTEDRPLDNQLEILYDQVCRVTEASDATYVVRYDEYTKDRSKKFLKECFENTIAKPFENILIPVPIGYDEILKKRFGESYIVPRQEMAAHDYPYYQKQFDEKLYRKEMLNSVDNNVVIGTIPDEKTLKKRILYHTTVKDLLINGDNMLRWIKNFLLSDVCDNSSEEIWWMPDAVLRTENMALDLIAPNLTDEYDELIRMCSDKGGNLCKCSLSSEELTRLFDEYHGTDPVYVDAFRVKNLRVTIEDYTDETAAESDASDETDNVDFKIPDQVRTVCEEWKSLIKKENGMRKKVVLYTTSASALFQHGEKMLTKIENVIKTFSEHKEDVALLWHPDPAISSEKEIFDKQLMEHYNELVEEFRLNGWGIYDDHELTGMVLNDIDGAYGDTDPLLLKCMDIGKPVMLQDVRF